MSGNPITSEIAQKYGNRVRVRACGLCWKENTLLMVNHRSLTRGDFWAPPGGGVEFGQSAPDALIREFQEETTIIVKPGKLLFTCEYIQPPLHAVELFFEAFHVEGEPLTGSDPETASETPIITDVKFLDFNNIMMIPADERHGVFRLAQTADDFKKLAGFYRI